MVCCNDEEEDDCAEEGDDNKLVVVSALRCDAVDADEDEEADDVKCEGNGGKLNGGNGAANGFVRKFEVIASAIKEAADFVNGC